MEKQNPTVTVTTCDHPAEADSRAARLIKTITHDYGTRGQATAQVFIPQGAEAAELQTGARAAIDNALRLSGYRLKL